jgi:Zn-dependent protease
MNFLNEIYALNGKKRVIKLAFFFSVLLVIDFLMYHKNNPADAVISLVFHVLALCAAIIIHNLGHSWAASLLGDPTPRAQGRFTLNLKYHLDLFGTICFLVTGLGWGRLTEIWTVRLKRPGFYSVLIIIAGPIANLIAAGAAAWIFGTVFLNANALQYSNTLQQPGLWSFIAKLFIHLFKALVNANLLIFFFNLFPVPPLDCGRLVTMVIEKLYKIRLQDAMSQNVWVLAVVLFFTNLSYTVKLISYNTGLELIQAFIQI